MSRAMTEAFVRNLKLLNAKERDHLMRFAYLGQGNAGSSAQSDAYESTTTFLSPEADLRLRDHLEGMVLKESAKCVFACMDYHLDWLYAALCIAKQNPDWSGQTQDLPVPKPMSLHEATDQKSLYTDFRPLNGSQEDVDLLVVYDDGEKLAVLIIEAKGSASFDKVQLARKIVRLDSIIADSGASSHGGQSLKFRLVLAAPSKPQNFDCCLKFVNSLPPARPGEPDRFKTIREALEKLRPDSIGTGLHFLEITGFPKPTFAVERSRGGAGSSGKSEVGESDGSAGTFTHWALKER